MDDKKEITKRGRPSVITKETVDKLVEVLRLGVKDGSACAHAGIHRATFYDWIKKDDDFSDKIENARNFAVLAARQNVVKEIVEEKNVELSKWYIEKHDLPQQAQFQQNTQVNVFADLKNKYMKKPEEVVEVNNEHAE